MPKKANMRAALYLLQLGRCIWCGEVMSGTRRKSGNPARDFATFEHIVPRSEGGGFNWSNIMLACCKCNLRRNHEFQVAKNASVSMTVQVSAQSHEVA